MAFDDDESPAATTAQAADATAEDNLEDEMPDFTKFNSAIQGRKGFSGKAIRRGEKDFESHGTKVQDAALESSRQAMEGVLSNTRTHMHDLWVRAWYFPDRWADEDPHDDEMRLADRVVVVENAKGTWLKTIGRVNPAARDPTRRSYLWLLPEEALHMVERGTVDLWWPDRPFEELLPLEGKNGVGPEDYSAGVPLSLEAAYSLLIGEDGQRGKVSLPKFQVYSHLKRGGMTVLRAPPTLDIRTKYEGPSGLTILLHRLLDYLNGPLKIDSTRAWGPLVQPGLYRAYAPIYQSLFILPRHKPVAYPTPRPEPKDPFRVFYYVYKGGDTDFAKAKPPPPDFRVAVADTASSGVPDLEQIDALMMSSTPYDPPEMYPHMKNMYQRLKHGHRNVLVAVVDHGLVNFMRFAEGAFGQEKLFPRFDGAGARRGGKKRGGSTRGRGRGRR